MPRVLDLFCGAGGCSFGYHKAGYDVMGVDINPQPHYPFAIIQMDVIELLREQAVWIRNNFDLVHASPPCQHYSVLRALHKDVEYVDLIDQVRNYLMKIGLPYVIENVQGAPLIKPIRLCGTMFDLRLFRHRYFEIGVGFHYQIDVPQPQHVSHRKLGLHAPSYARKPDYEQGEVHSIYGHFTDVDRAREAMGIGWMVRDELAQAIPPAYTEYIGKHLNKAKLGLVSS